MKLTIKDIANKAKVSTATVSRVINNVDLNKVSEKTRKKVLKIITECKYFPDIAGFSLSTGRKNTLGLIIPGENFLVYSYYFSEILRGVVTACNKFYYKLMLLTCEVNGMEVYKNIIRSRSVEGLIFVGSMVNDKRIFELKDENIPFVLVNNYTKDKNVSYVDSDNENGAFKATEYLISLGHRKIGFIKGPDVSINAIDRFSGFKKACKKNNVLINNNFIKTGDFSKDISFKVINEMLDRKDIPTAIFAADDTMAITALNVIKSRGYNVPEDISLVGFNNSPEATVVTPALTTVDQNIYSLGYEAGNILISKFRKDIEIESQKVIDVDLIIRDSCKNIKGGLSNKLI